LRISLESIGVVLLDEFVKSLFTNVTKGWMAKVMCHARSFNDLWVQASEFRLRCLLAGEFLRETSSNLGYLNCVLLSRVEDAALAGAHDLRDSG